MYLVCLNILKKCNVSIRVTKFGSGGCCGSWEEKNMSYTGRFQGILCQLESWKGEERIGMN